MKQIKSLGIVFPIIVIILVLVVARTLNKNLFKKDPQYAIDVATKSINSISVEDLKKLSPQYMVVNLNNADKYNPSQFERSINIPFESLLDKTNRKVLDEARGEIVLFSDDISIVSKALLILNQLDITNVLILHPKGNPEIFKYKFQPDTTAKLE